MADINATLIPLTGPIKGMLNTFKVLVGGVFGIYVLMLIVNIRQYFMLKKFKNLMNNKLDSLSAKVDELSRKSAGKKGKKR